MRISYGKQAEYRQDPVSGDFSFRSPQHRSLRAVIGASAPGSVTVCLVKALVAVLRNGLTAILRFLFGLLPMDSGTDAVVVEQQAGGGDMPPMEAEDPFILWVILEYVAMIALLIVCVFLLYRGILKLITFLRDRMQFSLPGTVSEQPESMDKREHLEAAPENTAAKQKQKWFSFAFLDAGQKIRRMYQKK